MNRIVTFATDSDGLTLIEFVAIVIIIIWAGVTGLILFNLNNMLIEFYNIFIWIPMAVVSGLFGQGITGQILRRTSQEKIATAIINSNQETTPNAGTTASEQISTTNSTVSYTDTVNEN